MRKECLDAVIAEREACARLVEERLGQLVTNDLNDPQLTITLLAGKRVYIEWGPLNEFPNARCLLASSIRNR